MQADEKLINVEVAYALPEKQMIIAIKVPEGTTAKQAIELSNITEEFADIDLTQNKIGIFSKLTSLATVLREKDRVEIYRPLIADPKEVRKQRAEKLKQQAKS